MLNEFFPMRGRVLLKTIDEYETDGVYLPEKKKNDFCEVIRIGEPDPIYTPEYEVGDQVLIPYGIGRDIFLGGEQFVLVFQHQILMTKKKSRDLTSSPSDQTNLYSI